jgi:biotin carboxyl carrier protein
MKDKHIINLIESTSLASLSESDLTMIRAHTGDCSDCRRAFEAAQISALLLKQRAAVTFEPSPFFHTRVLASLRERQAISDSWAWGRMWQAAGALASSMVATVAALAVLTFVVPGNQVASGTQVSSLPTGYSAEEVILNQTDAADTVSGDQVSDGQLMTTIYGADEEAVK